MKLLKNSWTRLHSLVQRPAVKREIDEELRFHIEQRTAENIAAGMSPEDAAMEARKRFGNFQSIREECREAKGASFGETTLKDIRFGLRMLRKNPGFTAITILTLALGVAGNIIIFTIYSAFYLRPYPFVEPHQLVDLDESAPRWNVEAAGLAYPDFYSWREHNRSFQNMGAWTYADYNLSFEGDTERAHGTRATHDLASVLGIKPVLGRLFLPEEDRPGGAKVVLLGNGFWKRQFGGREDIIGQTLKLDHEPFTIIGVLPPENSVLVEGQFWVPLALDPNARQGWFLRGIGRLKDGVSLSMAREDLRRIHQGLVEDHRAEGNTTPRLITMVERLFGPARLILQVLLGATSVVLLIACGNVAALMLARGLARSRELGIRLSLGATPGRLAQLIGIESLLLAGLGGLVGMVVGHRGLRVLLNSLADQPPGWVDFGMDWRVWLGAGLMVVAAALLGSLPVIRAALKLDLHGIFQSSAQQSTTAGAGRRSLHLLVVAEVALTLVLMTEAGLLVQAFRSMQRVDPGYRPDHVLIYDIALPGARYISKEAQEAFFQEHLEHVRALPGVDSASAANFPPLGGHSGTFYTIENAPPRRPEEPNPAVLQRIAFPGYFETMGVTILAGRSFTEQDGRNRGSQVVIVDESFAKGSWPNETAVGKRIRNTDRSPWLTVIGVARDVKHYGLDQPIRPGVYIPYAQDPGGRMSIIVRSSVAPTSLVPSVRALVRQSDPDLPVYGVVTMEERLSQSMWVRRLSASLFSIFAGVALLMALGGIYGVFSYVVSRRTQEMGVRLALGAQRRDVMWLVVRQGLALASTGIGIGLLGDLMVAPLMRSLLFGISPFDPFTFASIALLLTVVSLLACWLPARRAMKIQPMEALRCE